MENSQRNSQALTKRVDVSVAQLAQRFENIIALAPISAPERNATAVDAYQLEVETAALIRAAEDILTLTRSLKEMWLFGQLDTIGESKFNERTEEAARGVLEGLQKVVEMREKGLNPDAGIRS